jgi:hypothetical protein
MKTLALIPLVLLAAVSPPDNALVVHEWGTFTCLQDETGKAISGINTDDEPVPHFVRDLAWSLLIPASELPNNFFQGAPRCHPDVTMRLETPVIYFHLPKYQTKPLTLDVNVEFRGGWLTQFYPAGDAVAPGVESWPKFGHLRSDTVGTLSWPALAVGTDAKGPGTKEHVWTSPRAVDAASVTTTNGESEKFLFYRGVAHIDAPLQVARDTKGDRLVLRSQLDPALQGKLPLVIRRLWLTEIRAGGSSAFRRLDPVTLTGGEQDVLATTPATFAAGDFSRRNTAVFRKDMRQALMEEGLFGDEADALLNTWELSYFKSAGLRLFFIVPRVWTDYYLPLQISAPAQVQRMMMGRIELVTPAQRELLQKIAAGPAPDFQKVRPLRNMQVDRSSAPPLYRTYLDLGRFRNALVLDEQKRRPTDALGEFIQKGELEAYKIPAD